MAPGSVKMRMELKTTRPCTTVHKRDARAELKRVVSWNFELTNL